MQPECLDNITPSERLCLPDQPGHAEVPTSSYETAWEKGWWESVHPRWMKHLRDKQESSCALFCLCTLRGMGYTCLPSPGLKKSNLATFVSSAINKSNIVAHRHTHFALSSYKPVVVTSDLVSFIRASTDILLRLYLYVFNSKMPPLWSGGLHYNATYGYFNKALAVAQNC